MLKILSPLLIPVFFFASTLLAADLDSTIQTCNDCHGNDGVSEWSDVPTIAGISEFVLSDALYIYRDQERPCEESDYRQGDTERPATDMCAIAADFSDDEIDAIAEHFAGLTFKPAKQAFDAALVDAGKSKHDDNCENCHADSGRDAAEDAGILAGQWTEYLREQFQHYRDGTRSQPEKMEKKVATLTDQDIEALLNFYASMQ